LPGRRVRVRCSPAVLPPFLLSATSACRDRSTGLRAALSSPKVDDGLLGRRSRRPPLDDDGLVAIRRNQLQVLDRDLLDPPWRPEGLDLEPEGPVQFLLARPLPLEGVHLVAAE